MSILRLVGRPATVAAGLARLRARAPVRTCSRIAPRCKARVASPPADGTRPRPDGTYGGSAGQIAHQHGGAQMDDMKKGYREAEESSKEAWRNRDGESVTDAIGNAGDDMRKKLGDLGDDARDTGNDAANDADRDMGSSTSYDTNR
jgi:hypothetical protein